MAETETDFPYLTELHLGQLETDFAGNIHEFADAAEWRFDTRKDNRRDALDRMEPLIPSWRSVAELRAKVAAATSAMTDLVNEADTESGRWLDIARTNCGLMGNIGGISELLSVKAQALDNGVWWEPAGPDKWPTLMAAFRSGKARSMIAESAESAYHLAAQWEASQGVEGPLAQAVTDGLRECVELVRDFVERRTHFRAIDREVDEYRNRVGWERQARTSGKASAILYLPTFVNTHDEFMLADAELRLAEAEANYALIKWIVGPVFSLWEADIEAEKVTAGTTLADILGRGADTLPGL